MQAWIGRARGWMLMDELARGRVVEAWSRCCWWAGRDAPADRLKLRFPLAAPIQQQHCRYHRAVDDLTSRLGHLRD
ncbi:hypothetical protein OKW30_000329 [Paraburkholderia sp. Clong3]